MWGVIASRVGRAWVSGGVVWCDVARCGARVVVPRGVDEVAAYGIFEKVEGKAGFGVMNVVNAYLAHSPHQQIQILFAISNWRAGCAASTSTQHHQQQTHITLLQHHDHGAEQCPVSH